MSDLNRLVITSYNDSLTIEVRPNGNTMLTLLTSVWTAGMLLIAAGAAYVLWVGGFPVAVWVVYAIGLGAMVIVGGGVVYWNVLFTKVIKVSCGALTIESNGVRRRREVPLDGRSVFRIVGPPWPYNYDVDFVFLGLGIWGVEAFSPNGVAKLITRMNRGAVSAVAKALRTRGFRVEVPFPSNGPPP